MLVGLGHVVLDQLMLMEQYPQMDSKTTAILGCLCTGGPVARALLSAAALGVPTAFAGCVGQDEAGRQIQADLLAAGVNQDAVIVLPGHHTPRASIWVEARQGKRTVVLDRGNLPDYPAGAVERLPLSQGLLLLDGKESQALAAARRARSTGMEVMLDLGGPRDDMHELVMESTVVAVSKAFIMTAYPGLDLMRAVENLVEAGPRLAIITLGAGGAVFCERGQAPGWFPSWHPGQVMDSTGAGDVYHGVLAWALLQGFTTRKALACAAVGGGLACRQLGSAVPNLSPTVVLNEVEQSSALFQL